MTLGNPHNIVDSHEGALDDAQIADGTPTAGQVPISDGDGTRTWGDMSGGGGLAELVTGNDQDFASSLGSWVNSGGTMTRDTTYKMASQTASLKFAVTTSGQYVELAISGTFEAQTEYIAVFFISNESTSSTFNADLIFGLIGTDSATESLSLNMGTNTPYNGDGSFTACAVRWRPTADRTGVKARFSIPVTATTTWHIGMLRVWQTPVLGTVFVGDRPYMPMNFNDTDRMHLSPFANGTSGFNASTGGPGNVWMYNPQADTGIDLLPKYMYLFAESTIGDLSQEGFNLEVGTDYLGFFISQKDANTVQFYADFGDYDFEFQDGSTGRWYILTSAAIRKNFATMENRVNSGSATITSGNTSIAVTHGAGYTPAAADIRLLPTNSPTNDPGNFWVSSIGATQFTINVRNDPGASGAIFTWVVDR